MNNKVRYCVFSTALLMLMVFQPLHGRPHQASASELIEGIEEQIEEQIEEIEELIDPTHSIFGSHHHHKPGTPAGGTLPTGFPARPIAPGGLPAGSATAGGAGQGSVENGVATATGTGLAQAGADGFGIGLGIGISIATPLGNISVGQGESSAVGK